MSDHYKYTDKGLEYTSKELKLKKFYPRNKVSRKGIDVSKWQGKIDWKKVKKSGVEFVIIREGYGRKFPNQTDKEFHSNMKAAKSVGMKCGIYHFSYALSESEAVAEAEFCLENIRGYSFEYPVAFDIEIDEYARLGKRKLTDICKAFCNRLRKEGYYVCVYANFNWVTNFLYMNELGSSYDLWLARYNNLADHICGMWQYSSVGKINGIYGHVDLDVCYFDYPLITKELKLNRQ